MDKQTFVDLAAMLVSTSVYIRVPDGTSFKSVSRDSFDLAEALWKEREARIQKQTEQENSEAQPMVRPGPDL